MGGEDGGEPLRITHAQLITVIRQRTEQITNEIERALKELGFSGPVGRQVVLTGGGAELNGIADYFQQSLGRAVRIGRPRGLVGLPEAHSGPAFATLSGLVYYAASNPIDLRATSRVDQTVHRAKGFAAIRRFVSAVKANY